jgi:carbamoyltransferase
LWAFFKYAGQPLKDRFISRFPRVDASRILGIACTGHGASLAYMDAAGTLRCSQLERWTAVKHMMMFSRGEDESLRNPQNDVDRTINYVFRHGFGRFPDSRVFEDNILPWTEWLLRDLNVRPPDIDLVITSNGHFATGWARLGSELQRWFPNATVVRAIEHHEIHQRQAFWPSGFDEAAVLTLDTCGEPLPRLRGRKLSGTISVMNSRGEHRLYREFLFPEMSSGTIYDATTHYIGFRQGSEGKTMGLAAFGGSELFERLRSHLHLHDDGGFEFLSPEAFDKALEEYVTGRLPEEEINQRHRDVAYAGQAILEAIVANAWRAAVELTGQRSLVYAGGVALNSVANQNAYQQVRPERLYIPPNPGDPGQALGCVLFGAYEIAGWTPPAEETPEYLGPLYALEEIERALKNGDFSLDRPADLNEKIATCIANGHIVARFDGGAEFGPRALGNRSILCDPRRPGMKDYLNLRVKHREPFRPFAPSVLEEHAADWFELNERSPYMLRVVPIRPEKIEAIPAVAHVDGTARLQTVSRRENPGYWRLINTFRKLSEVPLVLNTSFNIAGKPIVETPQDALACFTSTEIDVLMMGPCVVSKRDLSAYLTTNSAA